MHTAGRPDNDGPPRCLAFEVMQGVWLTRREAMPNTAGGNVGCKAWIGVRHCSLECLTVVASNRPDSGSQKTCWCGLGPAHVAQRGHTTIRRSAKSRLLETARRHRQHSLGRSIALNTARRRRSDDAGRPRAALRLSSGGGARLRAGLRLGGARDDLRRDARSKMQNRSTGANRATSKR